MPSYAPHMSPTDRAWQAFLELDDEPTLLVEFLSFVYVLQNRKDLVRLLNRYLQLQNRPTFSATTWLARLKDLNILEGSNNQLRVTRAIVEDVACHSLAHRRSTRMCEFLSSNFYSKQQTLLLQARWALYSGDGEWFLQLAQRKRISDPGPLEKSEIVKVVSQGFSQGESFSRLPPEMARLLCERFLSISVEQASPVPRVWTWYRAQAQESRDQGLYESQLFFREKYDFPATSSLGVLQRVLKGDLSNIEKLGTSGFCPAQKFFYVIACYAKDLDTIIGEVIQDEDEGFREWSDWFWQNRNGQTVGLPHKLVLKLSGAEYPPLAKFFGYLYLFWAGFERELSSAEVRSLASTYSESGYSIFSRELNALADHMKGETNALTPFLSLLAPSEAWEAKLSILETFLTKQAKAAKAQSVSSERLVWALNPKTLTLKAKIQKVSRRGGWSKGRTVEPRNIKDQATEFMTETDHEILRELQSHDRYAFRYRGITVCRYSTLEVLQSHPHLYLPNGKNLRLSRQEPCLCVTEFDQTLQLKLEPEMRDGTDFALRKIRPRHYAIVTFQEEQVQFRNIIGSEGMELPRSEESRIQAIFAQVAELGLRIESSVPSADEIQTKKPDGKLAIRLLPKKDGLSLEVLSEIEDIDCHYPPGSGPRFIMRATGGKTYQFERDLKKEKEHYQELQQVLPQLKRYKAVFSHPGECLQALESIRQLPQENYVLQWPQGKRFQSNTEIHWSDVKLSLSSSQDWFTVDTELQLEGEEHFQLSQLLELQRQQGTRFIKLDDNRYLTLTQDLSKRLKALEAAATLKDDGQYEISPLAASVLAETLGLESEDEAWTRQKERLEKAQKLKPLLPESLKTTLRPYQKQGFDWLARSAAWGVGVCLADDMGLGKTVQILSLLLSRSHLGPTLVVAPTSVCANWKDEVEKFTPELKVILLHEAERQKAIQSVGPGDVLVASYGLMSTNVERLKKIDWNVLVLDESQAIKNNQTQRFKAAISLQADFRVAATGTPIENNLGELWSLFRFLNPGLLGAQRSFAARYANDPEAQSNLRDLIAPFLLRRLKGNVLKDLPPKTDITLKVHPTREEQLFYESVRLNAIERVESSDESSFVSILAELMRLRRACCHPKLVDSETKIVSSKLERFQELLTDLHSAGHKVLVFSQFVGHLKILEAKVNELGLSYQYLDGSTPPKKRKKAVEAFQNGENDVFLISLKAGGTGLNLTQANYVVHMDPWWNPATEDQASDRAHRIGQQKPVTVYRLVTAGTIEEKILELHSQKRELVDSLLQGSDRAGKLSSEELLALLRESAFAASV